VLNGDGVTGSAQVNVVHGFRQTLLLEGCEGVRVDLNSMASSKLVLTRAFFTQRPKTRLNWQQSAYMYWN
jgi:hypothetical protein